MHNCQGFSGFYDCHIRSPHGFSTSKNHWTVSSSLSCLLLVAFLDQIFLSNYVCGKKMKPYLIHFNLGVENIIAFSLNKIIFRGTFQGASKHKTLTRHSLIFHISSSSSPQYINSHPILQKDSISFLYLKHYLVFSIRIYLKFVKYFPNPHGKEQSILKTDFKMYVNIPQGFISSFLIYYNHIFCY